MTTAAPDDVDPMVEILSEALIDAQRLLAAEDRGWALLGEGSSPLTLDEIRTSARVARIMAAADPLIKRAVNLRIAYVWGRGVTVTAAQEDGAEQDVNAVLQRFLADQESTYSGTQAREERERALATDGNVFLALPTSPASGRVQVRRIPMDQIADIVTNPDDSADPWLYKRTWSTSAVMPVIAADGATVTRTNTQTMTVWYPALGFRPPQRPKEIDGIPIEWDTPVLHVAVNRPEGSLYGVGDLYAALPWARGYKGFLEDWAKLVKALSRIAFRATAKGGKASQVRGAIASAPVDGIGGTAVMADGQTFEAVNKSGATIDSNSGRPLAAMVAAATDVPVTMLLADPGVTGARATAETLDRPTEMVMGLRQDVHGQVERRIAGHVIDSAIKAPQGPLRGTVTIDRYSGAERVELAGGQDRTVSVSWPDLSTPDVGALLTALQKAEAMDVVPLLELARLVLQAFEVDDVDGILADMVDDQGEFVRPSDRAAANSALGAVSRGDLPGSPASPPDAAPPEAP